MLELNRIYNMDCREGLKLIPDKSVDLAVTDPPYEIQTSGAGIYKQPDKQYVKELNLMKDGFSPEILDELCRVLKKINIYLFCSQKQIIPLLDYFVKEKGCNWNLLTWHKTNPVPACNNKYLTDTEFILFFREKGVKIYGEFKTKFTYYVTPLNQKDKKLYKHPTIKPLEIVENLIINSSREGDVILDPFIGSGTTAVASKKLNRNYVGFEISEEYCKIAEKRVSELEAQEINLLNWLDELLGVK
ncbi:MAG: site-specific DNA-methyltransferase [Caldicoprobacterales bacterium]